MKHKLPKLSCFLTLLCLSCITNVLATETIKTTIDGLNYKINLSEKYASVDDNSNVTFAGDFFVPDSINYEGTSYPVKELLQYSFYRWKGLTSITIPNSVKRINYCAIVDCDNLKRVNISEATRLANRMIGSCDNLEIVDFGNSLITDTTAFEPLYFTPVKEIIIRNPKCKIPDNFFIRVKNRNSYYHTNIYEYLPLEKLTLPYNDDLRCFFQYGFMVINEEDSYPGANIEECGHPYGGKFAYPGTLREVTFVGDAEKRYKLINTMFPQIIDVINFENITFDEVDEFYSPTNGCNFSSFAFDGYNLPNGILSKSIKLKQLTLSFPGSGNTNGYGNFGELFGTRSIDGTRAVTQYFEDGTTKTYYIPTSLEELTIAEGCGMIPYGGLSNCNMLKKLTLPTTLYMVGEKALHGCAQLADIHCLGADPAVAYDNSFDGMRLTSCKLHVPYNSGDLYKNAEGWKRFYNIQEEAGVEDVTVTPADAAIVGYYNLQGVRSDEPWPGLNIAVYSDGSTRKILNR